MNITLAVKLPSNRDHLGVLHLVDAAGELLYGPRPVLGRSDNIRSAKAGNPGRNPQLPYGDTPLGLFRMTPIPPDLDANTFGRFRRFLLTAKAGPCVDACVPKGKRSGLLLHGGALNPKYTWWGGLRPSYGCLRGHDEDLEAIAKLYDQRAADLWLCDVSAAA